MSYLVGFGAWGVVVTEAGSYLRLIDSCITQLEDQGPFRTCNESKEEEEAPLGRVLQPLYLWARILRLIDSCITQLKAQGLFRTCNESKEEEEEAEEVCW